ncbi:O-antigen ligase family protein [Chelativorans sp. Marseille-P2723]|uniref:O-antigen ligase family protein n=1 Tax=Chelativorans sp. Marseille-P2723 TaxID=2709133 RepID=UPI001FF0461F|nr:O-antigen ligase family protein [Chelativorans sp. Marseille-P2723]
MSTVLTRNSNNRPPTLRRGIIDARLIEVVRASAIVLGVFLCGFVVREPAPYEIYMVGLMGLWGLFGLRFTRHVMPLLILLVLFNIGGIISMSQLADLNGIPLYIAVSLFLALTAVFFASVVEAEPPLLPLIFRAWSAAAVVTSVFGILGYFRAFPGAEMFTRYGRAAGVFEDPNVFGPFITLPGIFLLHHMMTGRPRTAFLAAPAFLIITLGAFLSFSRGAWGLFIVSAAMLTLALFIHHRSVTLRLRIATMTGAALAIAAVTLIVALQIPAVAELFSERARLVQDYDGARLGRFARHWIGFMMAIEHPLGIGPLEFGQMLGEDTHNIWLKALLDYSWLGFAAWLILMVWTLAACFRILFRVRPWQPYLLVTYVVFVGHILLGTVIDTDHWRHFYLILGMLWGMLALEQRHQSALREGKKAEPSAK